MNALGFIGRKLDLTIRQGATFGPYRCTITNPDDTPVDLAGSDFRGQIRKRALDTAVAATIAVSITDAANGKFEWGLSDEATAAIAAGETFKATASNYVWDLEMQDSLGNVLPLLYGDVQVFREVTRV